MASVWIEEAHGGYVIKWREHDERRTSPRYERKSEAEVAASDLRKRLGPTVRRRRAGERPREVLTIHQIAERWAEAKLPQKVPTPGHADHVADVLGHAKRLADALHWVAPGDAEAGAVERYLHAHERRGRRQLSYLRTVLRWAARTLDQPLDHKADLALAAPASQEAEVELLTEKEAADVQALAEDLCQGLLISCLATYGWRPITACRLTVGDVDLEGAVIRLTIKASAKAWRHPLFPFHVDQIKALSGNRSKGEPLFLNPQGEPWKIAAGKARALDDWYRDNLKKCHAQGSIYQLKRWAITRMAQGAAPWNGPLSIAQIQLYTGHRTKIQVTRYLRTNIEDARSVMGSDPGGNNAGHKGAVSSSPGPSAPDTGDEKVLRFPGVAG